ncbi:hypothetical protein C9374_002875 [Naegleria lovaniensis]|uniref:EGF-like domain-containing protein n=1 Tax=Naegleria lovaniensis TaxID=51637 RepID=A0AA88GUK6_NAELO|nr:uncharacterized protein C9374_002875 [Naegleria lovaniensis]KAG2386429.1 hypothetical protein C9374_002875 [Naegleria lovaniensis]
MENKGLIFFPALFVGISLLFCLLLHNTKVVQCANFEYYMETLAGTGGNGFAGENLTSSQSGMSGGLSLLLDPTQSFIYYSDYYRLRRVDLNTNMVTTVLGTGVRGYSTSTGLAANAQALYSPNGLAWWRSNSKLLVGENTAIRQIDMTTGYVSLLAGGTSSGTIDHTNPLSAKFSSISCLFVHSNDDIYVCDGSRIRKVDGSTLAVTTVAGGASSGTVVEGSPVSSTLFNSIYDLKIDTFRVRKITNNGGTLTTVNTLVGTGGTGSLAYPSKMFYDSISGDLYITQNYYISKYSSGGTFTHVLGTGQYYSTADGSITSGTSVALADVRGIAIDSAGVIYFSEAFGSRLRKYTGSILSSIINTASIFVNYNPAKQSPISSFRAQVMDRDGNFYYSESDSACIKFYNMTSQLIKTYAGQCFISSYQAPSSAAGLNGPAIMARFNQLSGLAIDDSGDLIIAEQGTYSIKKVSKQTGIIILVAGSGSSTDCADGTAPTACGLNFPRAVAFYDGELYFSVYQKIRKISKVDGKVYTVVGGGGSNTDNILGTASSVTCGTTLQITPNGLLYYVDTSLSKIRVYNINSGIVNTIGRSLSYVADMGWAFSINNEVFFGTGQQYLKKIDSVGNLYSVAGNGMGTSENANAINTALTYIYSIAWSSQRKEYITFEAYRIRRMYLVCSTGWQGDFCDVPVCSSILASDPSVCSGNGNCSSPNNCQCFPNYFGANCSVTTCFGVLSTDPTTCNGNGNCSSPHSCVCEQDYYGNSCNITTCFGRFSNESSVCGSKGNCISKDQCTCYDGYIGNQCEIPICNGTLANDTKVCNGHGSCILRDTCACNETYFGNVCEFTLCFGVQSNSSLACNSHGQCSSFNNCTCDHNYFGANCSLTTCFGIRSDNNSVCSNNGECLQNDRCSCYPHFYGDKCDLMKCFGTMSNDSLVCSGHGSCDGFDNCTCYENYFGSNCSITTCFGIRSDNNSVCNSLGKCTSVNNCSCDLNYFGSNCSLTTCFGVRSDNTSVCNSHGQCTSFDNCTCDLNYFGLNCSLTSCFGISSNESSVCSGSGQCIDFNSCDCHEFYEGMNCSLRYCNGLSRNNSNICGGHGTCQDDGVCNCQNGWAGVNCSIPYCFGIIGNDSSACNSHGQCTSFNNCTCDHNYFGTNCSLTTCFGHASNDSDGCSGNGVCIDFNTCNCKELFEGYNCSFKYCNGMSRNNSNVCGGHGTCQDDGICNCYNGWVGSNCSIPYCFGIIGNDSSACNSHGQCTSFNNCSCDLNYFGTNCSLTTCFGVRSDNTSVCNSHGQCTSFDNCTCDLNYFGLNCSLTSCFGISSNESSVCSGSGQCIDFNSCDCHEFYEGMNCSLRYCNGLSRNNSNICGGHGTCQDDGVCNCQNVWAGVNCSIPYCFGIIGNDSSACNSHGQCTSFNNCTCDHNYFGTNCSLTSCFGISSNESAVCSGSGQCIDFNSCDCHEFYEGMNCSLRYCNGLSRNNSNVCGGHGTCQDDGVCNCHNGWAGVNCSIPYCFGIIGNDTANTCSGNGNCISNNVCECFSGWLASNCSESTCFNISGSSACNSHGKCISKDVCYCDADWVGANCSVPICFGQYGNSSNTCSGNGECILPNYCACNNGYYGQSCNTYDCFYVRMNETTTCNGNGNCTAPNICNCSLNYFGQECETTTCFGINSSDPFVCNGHGNCSRFDHCSCYTNYTGNNCSIRVETGSTANNSNYVADVQCFGINSTDGNVCSGHGFCSSTNNCTCYENYFGDSCNITSCFNSWNNDSNACNSHGQCTSFNNCTCDHNYFGTNCSLTSCFGISSNESAVCSGSGQCIDFNSCDCNEFYEGTNCELTTCFGINSTTVSSACSSHGQCIAHNKCKCMNGYSGDQCQFATCNSILSNDSTRVCNGNGECVSPDTCTCSGNNYGGQFCDTPICFGKLGSDNASVCSGKGFCMTPNHCTCVTSTGYSLKVDGFECENLSCKGSNNRYFASTDQRVCSNGNGDCVLNSTTREGGCKCNDGYSGEYCQLTSCFGIDAQNSSVCGGHGQCIAYNYCNCSSNEQDGFWYGYNCESCLPTHTGPKCNIPTCNSTSTCNNHGECENLQCACRDNWNGRFCDECRENYFGQSCDIYCSKETNCSGHGACIANGQCSCYQSSSQGYWAGNRCDMCLNGYYGEECATKFVGQPQFNDLGSALIFHVFAPASFSSVNIECSKLLELTSNEFGTSPICGWTHKDSGLFMIRFGENPSILPNQFIRLNRNVFNIRVNVSDYVSVQVIGATTPIQPMAFVDISSTRVGLCNDIELDGSASFSGDGRELRFNWTAMSSPSQSILQQMLNQINGNATIKLSSAQLQSGIHTISLQVRSTFSGSLSIAKTVTFEREPTPIPSIEIVGKNVIANITSNDLPLLIKKSLKLPVCDNGDLATSVKLVWKQLSGPKTDYQSDSFNNLLISKFYFSGERSYQYALQLLRVTDNSLLSEQLVTIYTVPQDLILDISSEKLTSSTINIIAEMNDPDETTDTLFYQWTCRDVVYNGLCSDSIQQLLSDASVFQNNSIQITNEYAEQLEISLKVTKGTRSAQSSVMIAFDNSPIINIIEIKPSKPSITQGTILSIQYSIASANDVLTQWALNGKYIDEILINRMPDKSLNHSDYILIDSSKLEEGSNHSVSLTALDLRTTLSATRTHRFQIARSPNSCICSLTPTEGVALETDFLFKCINCNNPTKLVEYSFGFVDDRSGANVPLYHAGERYSTKLPLPFQGNTMKVFLDVFDPQTMSRNTKNINVKIYNPQVISMAELRAKTMQWKTIENNLRDGDSGKSIYNAGTISRTTIGVLKQLNENVQRRRMTTSDKCNGQGSYNEEKEMCDCNTGYFKRDCSVSKSTYQYLIDLKFNETQTFISSYTNRNRLEKLSDVYLTLQAYGLQSLTFNYDEFNDSSITSVVEVTEDIVQLALNTTNLVLPYGVDQLIIEAMNSIYNYILYKNNGPYIYIQEKLLNIIQCVGKLLLRGQQVGEKNVHLKAKFSTLTTNKLWRKDFPSLVVPYFMDSSNKERTVLYPENIIQSINQKSTKTPVEHVVYTMNDFYNWNSTLPRSSQAGSLNTTVDTYSYFVSKYFVFVSIESSQIASPSLNDSKISVSIPVIDINTTGQIKKASSSTTLFNNNGTLFNKTIQIEETFSCRYLQQGMWISDTTCNLVMPITDQVMTCQCLHFGLFAITKDTTVTTNVKVSIDNLPEAEKSSHPKPQNSSSTVGTTFLWFLLPVGLLLMCLVIMCCMCVLFILRKKYKKKRENKKKPSIYTVEQSQIDLIQMDVFSM